jgi:hypothetical protein
MEIRKTPVSDEMPYYDWTLRESTTCLREILQEFPFADWKTEIIQDEEGEQEVRQSRSQAVQVAAMLSLFCTAMLPDGANRMGFIYNANSQRSGKTLLAKLAIMAVCGVFNPSSAVSKVVLFCLNGLCGLLLDFRHYIFWILAWRGIWRPRWARS